MKTSLALAAAIVLAATVSAHAASTKLTVNKIDASGVGAPIGTISFSDSKSGLVIQPHLKGMPTGPHGFHIHENPSCAPGDQNGNKVAGLGAGGHFDPDHTGKHLGPDAMGGHRGDMPVLTVDAKGMAGGRLLAPHLKVSDLKGHSLVIHAGGDNYSDQPAPLGGGGARIACGVFK
ncbi:MAG TPA: superoxide dismutase [Cu-Zn] SodC [Stellaceae bacterium]|nr:superoxide dismutase [Cu-Zn] SodC [Stellaceae bacterium]HYC13988.1 superoxide dismutase [Cu-Zn] SodC [Stellaceae bacterium]